MTAGAAVGLDVEEARRRTRGDPLRLAARRFSAAEAAAIQGAAARRPLLAALPCAMSYSTWQLQVPCSSSREAAVRAPRLTRVCDPAEHACWPARGVWSLRCGSGQAGWQARAALGTPCPAREQGRAVTGALTLHAA